MLRLIFKLLAALCLVGACSVEHDYMPGSVPDGQQAGQVDQYGQSEDNQGEDMQLLGGQRGLQQNNQQGQQNNQQGRQGNQQNQGGKQPPAPPPMGKINISHNLNSVAEVETYMRKHVYTYENDTGKNLKLLPFFSISAAQKQTLKNRSNLPTQDLFKVWNNIAHDKNYEYPRLWALRPDKSLTGDKLFAKLMKLPTKRDSGTGADHIVPISKAWYMLSERAEAFIVDGKIAGRSADKPWTYRGLTITRDRVHTNTWTISTKHPNFRWTFGTTPTNPTLEWHLNGDLHIGSYTFYQHPDSKSEGRPLLTWKGPSYFGTLLIYSSDVYGCNCGASIGFLRLSFMDALDVAINFITHIEKAYGTP